MHVAPGHTHHSHLGVSRASDLVLASAGLVITTRVHNSLHCKGLDCAWDLCHEYTVGDHFFAGCIAYAFLSSE